MKTETVASADLQDLNFTPPLAQAIPPGIQHVLAMFASNVTVPIIIAGAAGLEGEDKDEPIFDWGWRSGGRNGPAPLGFRPCVRLPGVIFTWQVYRGASAALPG